MVNPLSRVTLENYIKDKKPIVSKRVDSSRNSSSNLGNREENMIRDLITGSTDIVENPRGKGIMTLDEAADRIKNNR